MIIWQKQSTLAGLMDISKPTFGMARISLTVFDFNLSDHSVSVNRAHEFVKGKPRQKDPKTWNGFRTLPIPDKVYPAIHGYVESLKSFGKTYLFATQRGNPATLSCYRRMWERIVYTMQMLQKSLSRASQHMYSDTTTVRCSATRSQRYRLSGLHSF